MPVATKWILVLMLNALLSGFFGLGVFAVHFFWLEYATLHWPRVHYTDDYESAFAGTCAAALFVLLAVRQIRTRLESKFMRPAEFGFFVIFIVIVMAALTPVPGSSFAAYLYEQNHPVKPVTATNAVALPARESPLPTPAP